MGFWADEEIKKKTNGVYRLSFSASALGKNPTSSRD
jgi:hypothetical protein